MNKIIFGDCRATMRDLIAQSVKVQMCVTSPPYYGLRDYGHEGQIGLEDTPEQYIAAMVEVFGMVREILADDGVLWLNIGDSYAGGRRGGNPEDSLFRKQATNAGSLVAATPMSAFRIAGLKPKDLIGIPWMLAFALRADGWYLRQDIIWHKPNPMPESVTDRCTKAHEYIFLLSKSAHYYYDHEAIKEPCTFDDPRLHNDFEPQRLERGYPGQNSRGGGPLNKARSKRDSFKRDNSKRAEIFPGQSVGTHRPDREESDYDIGTRNKRSVWTVNTKSYSGAHFAVFPEELIEPCILAGSRSGDIVLDPFMGSGTTAQVAQNLGRQWIGCELNQDYEPLQLARTAQAGFSFV